MKVLAVVLAAGSGCFTQRSLAQSVTTPQYPEYPSETPAKFVAPTAAMDYEIREEMIPMRDGVKLRTFILVPKTAKGAKRAGMLMTRTPYGVDGYTPERLMARKGPLVESGYIFVFEDIRGRYES